LIKTQLKFSTKFIVFSVVTFVIVFASSISYCYGYLENENRDLLTTITTRIDQFILLFIAIAILLFTLMYSFYRFVLLKPIGILMSNIEHIKNREFDYLQIPSNDDEFDKIAKNIDHLAAGIEAKERELQYIAEHDSLTGLYNRYYFNNILNEKIVTTKKDHSLALVFCDVDNFKEINDTVGHDIGDHLLVQIAQRLTSLVGDKGYLSRIGGDEFMIILSDIDTYDRIYSFIHQLHGLFDEPFTVDHHYLQVTISSGIVITDSPQVDVTTLYKEADIALYKSKEQGKNKFTIYAEEYSAQIHERKAIFEGIHKAINEGCGEFFLLYQPKIATKDGKSIKGAESLIRWESKKLGFMPPDKFIGIAEDSGLIIELGYWIIEQSCRDFLKMRAAGIEIEQMSINIASNQFTSKGFLDRVQEIIEITQIDPKNMEFELTERIIADNDTDMLETLHALQKAGIHIAIDDFGTGYSSLSYLQQLPVNRLKIDRSFVIDIDKGGAFNIVKNAIVPLAKTLKLETTAEGVETKGEYQTLKLMGVDDIQGYYFAKPMRIDEFIAFAHKQ